MQGEAFNVWMPQNISISRHKAQSEASDLAMFNNGFPRTTVLRSHTNGFGLAGARPRFVLQGAQLPDDAGQSWKSSAQYVRRTIFICHWVFREGSITVFSPQFSLYPGFHVCLHGELKTDAQTS